MSRAKFTFICDITRRGYPLINQKDLLILFAKSPYASDVKTRLSPIFSQKERACLQKAFILDTLSLTACLSVKRVLAYTPDIKDRSQRSHLSQGTLPFFTQCEKECSVLLIKQEGADLGQRMKNGFYWGFSRGFQSIVIIGSDSPTIPASFIKQAFNRLKTVPIVLGPAMDGGYYLIGVSGHVPDIFNNIKWGSDTVLSDTLMRLSRYALLPFWYDVDYQEDIDFLIKHLSLLTTQRRLLPINTLKLIKRLTLKRNLYTPAIE